MSIEEIKESWLRIIWELFIKRGLRSTSMDDIASALHISKKTLYQHFKNKEDIVLQCMAWIASPDFQEKVINAIEQERALVVLHAIKQRIQHDSTNYNIPAIFYDIKKFHPAIYDQINIQHQNFFNTILSHTIDKGIKEGVFKENENIKVQIWLITYVMTSLKDPELQEQALADLPKSQQKKISSVLLDNLVYSIATPEGLTEFETINKNNR
ncbi:MAG: TetR/AcrR family transcriptional regulator [Marinifilaceae bacterium]|nr:TetR/AcrR family transcriptional regulator [Marinifilaceae bacterium]